MPCISFLLPRKISEPLLMFLLLPQLLLPMPKQHRWMELSLTPTGSSDSTWRPPHTLVYIARRATYTIHYPSGLKDPQKWSLQLYVAKPPISRKNISFHRSSRFNHTYPTHISLDVCAIRVFMRCCIRWHNCNVPSHCPILLSASSILKYLVFIVNVIFKWEDEII